MNYNGLLELEVLSESIIYFELDSVRLEAFFKKQCELRHMVQKKKLYQNGVDLSKKIRGK